MEDIKVIGYKRVYKELTAEMQKNNSLMYDCMVVEALIYEFNRGMKAKRVCKPNKKGTAITYEAIKTIGEALKTREEIVEKRKEVLSKLREIGEVKEGERNER